MDAVKVSRIPLGDAILEYATFSDTTGALDDIMGLARTAYGYLGDWNGAVHRVADSLARYREMWSDMDFTEPPPCDWTSGKPMVPADDTVTPARFAGRTKDFMKRWSYRVHGRDPGLTEAQCWDTAQKEFACQL